jgi:sec-independent protein translocase protein TatB
MSFSDTIFLFFLALILFGPKKLPEMARQAGKLLAELRRASNEFKSQIETEIAHLEVEKSQTILPPTPSVPGTLASLSLNPPTAAQPALEHAPDTLAGPVAETAPQILNPAASDPITSNPGTSTSSTPPASGQPEPGAAPHASPAQEPNV